MDMASALADSVGPSLLARFDYPRFAERATRVLLVDAGYYIVDEVNSALRASGHVVEKIDAPRSNQEHAAFVRRLLTRSAALRPDLILTINHFGFDAEGHLAALLDRLAIPTAVWYVDDPTPILGGAEGLATDHTNLFVWDRAYLEPLAGYGFAGSRWLPLAVDSRRIERPAALTTECMYRLLFLGSSWTKLIDKARSRLSEAEVAACERAIGQLAQNGFTTHAELLDLAGCATPKVTSPAPSSPERQRQADRLAYIQRMASREWRQRVLSELPADDLTIVGDEAWSSLFPQVRHLPPSDYHLDTTAIYHSAAVTINVTSRQMPTAVNQRAFDVPAAGGFVLQDSQADLMELFPEDAVAVFGSAEEAREKAAFYLRNSVVRRQITQRALDVIEQKHTYEHRVEELIATMRSRFGG